MKKLKIASQTAWVVLFILYINSCNQVEKVESNQNQSFIDASQVRVEIETLGKQFTEEFSNQDSVALANHYTSDGMLGSVKGHDNLVSTWNAMIKNASENGTPNLLFITNSVATDDEYVVELGNFQWTDSDGSVKREGKYVVVWKQVGNEWKIYRDWGL